MLDDILEYHQTPANDSFVTEVMERVRRQQRVRKLILTVSGFIGGAFGAAGMLMISDSLSRLVSDANMLPFSIGLVTVAVILAWLFQDEVTASG